MPLHCFDPVDVAARERKLWWAGFWWAAEGVARAFLVGLGLLLFALIVFACLGWL